MPNALTARIEKLEAKIPAPTKQRRVIFIVCAKRDEASAEDLVRARGYDPDEDQVILRSIVVTTDGGTRHFAPYVRFAS